MRFRFVAAVAVLACATATGCQFPRDPEGTLDRVRDGTMRVGVVDNPPWVRLGPGEPRGVEPALVRRFAALLGAEIEWFEGTETDLVEAMRGYQLDVLIGGLTRSSLWAREVAITSPYLDTEVQFAVPPGTELPDDLDGIEVWVEAGSEAAALLQQEETDAIPRYYHDLEEIEGPALLGTHDIEAIGYERTDRIQRDHEHAMAVPMGENAFMVELERFLLKRGEEAERLLSREATR
jgi:polar amino acid transport system substrate-binding protein